MPSQSTIQIDNGSLAFKLPTYLQYNKVCISGQ